MSVEAKNVKAQRFTVPNYVLLEWRVKPRQEGLQELPAIPLADVDAEALSQLCDLFRADVFAKAGKEDPRATSE